jgi:GAF domain-containing protein/HAMP domain-containing protein
MVLLTLLAGGVSLWQVLTIGQAIGEARAKDQQRALSLEMMIAGNRLVASLDQMLMTEDATLMSSDVPISLGALRLYLETLQQAGGDPETLSLLGEMQQIYDELLQAVDEANVLARQERWEEVDQVMEQRVRPVNSDMNLLIRRLVQQADRDADAVTLQTESVVRQATVLLIILVVVTTGIALAWRQFVFQGLGLSISELRQGVERISSGDLEHKIDIRTGDEVEELGAEFNKMADELASVIGSLEQRVAERTRSLQTAAEVARATTAELDLSTLLHRVVNLVRGRFGLYYVGLFLLDEEGEFAVLRAGTGEAGRRLIEQGHRLKAGSESMIGQCVARSEARIALDVGEEAARFDNPFLPETRSEMALPMRSRGQVIGAMTVQSTAEAAFDETDIAIMQTMADQVAVAIDNARLFAETQTALEAMHHAYSEASRRGWTETLRERPDWGYRYSRRVAANLTESPIAPAEGDWRPEMVQAAQTEQKVLKDGGEGAALAIPLKVRDQVVGVLNLRKGETGNTWTADEVALLETMTEQLNVALEGAQLYQDTQRRAARERVIGEITTRMRETLDMETILKTAAQEVRRTLRLPEVVIRLGTSSRLPRSAGDGHNGDEPAQTGGEEIAA